MTAEEQPPFSRDQTKSFKKEETQPARCHSSHLLLISEDNQAPCSQPTGTFGLVAYGPALLEGIICAAHKNG